MKAINDAIMALVPRSSSSSGGGSTTVYVPVRDGNTGDGTSVVTPGTGTSTLTPYVRSDTTLPFTVRQGQAYCFKMTLVNGSNILPLFTVGNGSVFKTQYVAQIGNDYYFRIWAIGNVGESTGVYTTPSGTDRTAAMRSNHCSVNDFSRLGAVDGNRNLLPSKAAFLLGPPGEPGGNQGSRISSIEVLNPFLFSSSLNPLYNEAVGGVRLKSRPYAPYCSFQAQPYLGMPAENP